MRTGCQHSPTQAAERFALSQDTRTDGLLELEAYNIVDRKRSSINPNVFDFKRMRNVYDLHLEQLDVAPGQPRPEKSVTPQDIDNELSQVTNPLGVDQLPLNVRL